MRNCILKTSVFVIVALLWVSVAPVFAVEEPSPNETARTDYGAGVGKKLGRGLANTAFGWLEVPKGIEKVGDENNFIAALTWGTIYGAGNAVVRTLAGVYEIVTFPVPAPPNFEPLVKPDFPIN
jgi:putative exosortase-associated protein (TIGR04073 family)